MQHLISNSFSKTFMVLAVVAALLTSGCTETPQEKKAKPEVTTDRGLLDEGGFAKLTVNEPFEQVKSEYETYVIAEPASASQIKFSTGATAKVPAMAFVDADGLPVKEEVVIRYREFHDAADIITSGIPMNLINEQGQEEWFQTAGMFEIRGFRDNEEVFLANGKTIDISMLSQTSGDYDTWFFDEKQGNWTKTGRSENPELTRAIPSPLLERKIEALEAATAQAPVKYFGEEENNLVFNDLDLSACPGLEDRKSIVLNYAGTDENKAPKNNKWIADKGIWIKKELVPASEKDIYTLTLMGEKFYSIPVRLGLQGQDLEAAKARYKRAMADYNNKMKELMDANARRERQEAFLRTMKIANIGIHNYDLLMKRETAVPLVADFNIPGYNEIKKEVTVYMITLNGTAVIKLPRYSWDKFRFDPNEENTIVTVLPGDRIGLFTKEDFEAQEREMIASRGEDYTFNMTIQEGVIKSEEDLRGLLDM